MLLRLMDDLAEAARQAREHAYAPYSGYAVGAAVRDRDGRIWTGCNVENVAYPLSMCAERNAIAAMIVGGVCVLDEGNRMNEKSWASLAPLLDHRRYVESVVAGITIHAHPDFRVCVTMNEDESTYEVPDYILSRLQPTLNLGFPNRDDEMAILKYHLPFASDDLLGLTVEFLQQAHKLKLEFSPRDGLNILRYAIKRMAQDPSHPIGRDVAWREALNCVLGEEAADLSDLASRRRRALGGQHAPLGLGDLFFGPDDPLHPDPQDEDES